MPELPDVEVFQLELSKHCIGRKIKKAEIIHPKLLQTNPGVFQEKVVNKKISNIRRHGKYLFIECGSKSYIVMHFGLTGELVIQDPEKPLPAGTHLVLRTGGDTVIYRSSGLFGSVEWISDPEKFIRFKKIGPDAAHLSPDEFESRLHHLRGGIKAALMNQKAVSGLGNVYVDEILFQSAVHPQTPVQKLSSDIFHRIYAEMKTTVRDALKVHGARSKMPPRYLMKNRKAGASCPHGKGKLKRARINGRETFFCPECQKNPSSS